LNVKSTGDYWRMELMSRKMKDSGIEWIGEIPEEWKICKIKYLVTVVMGQSPSSDNYNLEGIGEPFLQGNADFADKYPIERVYTCEASKFADIGDILLSVRAPVGAKNIANKKYAIGRGLCALRTQSINKDLLWYLIDIMNKEFEINSKGSTYDSVTVSDVNNASIVIGSIDEQVRITTSLNSKCTWIDETIEKQKQVIEKLKEYRESIITEAVTKGLNPDVPMKDSGIEWIGKIPEHWKITTIKHLVDARDGTHDTPLYFDKSEYTYPLVTSKDFENGNINFENVKWISKEDYINISARSKVEEGDVLMSMIGGNIGKTVIIKGNSEFAIKNVALFRTGINHSLATIINYYLQCNMLKIQIDLKSRGGAQEFLGLGDIRNLIFFNMTKNEQNEIADYLDNKCSKIDSIITQKETLIDKLTEYKKSLIYECVTGKKEINIV
jgi:type I restriction enzyme, S subunit